MLAAEDGPNPAPWAYVVGANEAFQPEAISAVFDGTGAASAFLACCSIYSQNGLLISRDFPAQIAAGGSAEVTYHPFLRQQSSSPTPPPSSANLPWGMCAADFVAIAAVGVTVVDFTLANPNNSFGSSGDGVVTLGNVGGVQGPILNAQGVYRVSWHVFATTNVALAAGAEIGIASDWDTADIIAGENNDTFTLIGAGPAQNFDVGVAELLDLDPANYPIPNTGRVTIKNATGVALTGFVRCSAVLESTVTDPGIL